MNRANQQQLFQVANQEVINIRQYEIDYYINLFTVFGTNAAIIGGFTFGILTQNIINYTSKAINLYKYWYYVLAACTIASSVHVILCTMLVQVYGPGLALNGPLGSMARAAEGMKQEQKQIIVGVIIMVASFTSATIWLFFCVMNFWEAVAATGVFAIAIRYWYYYCERIYLRFYWKTQEDQWSGNPAERDSRMLSEDENPANFKTIAVPEENTATSTGQFKKKKISILGSWGFGKKKNGKDDGADIEMEASEKRTYGNGLLNMMFRNPENMSEEQRASITETSKTNNSNNKHSGVAATSSNRSVAMEGYLTMRGHSEQQIVSDSRRWERRYFVLSHAGDFYLYKSRQDFRQTPKKSLYSRPVRLIDFYVKVDNTDKDMRDDFEDDNKTVHTTYTTSSTLRGDQPPPFRFQITLVPRENEEYERGEGQGQQQGQVRNRWLLRCDTEEELQIWLAIIQEVCPSCFTD